MTLLKYLSRDILLHTVAISMILLLIIFSGRMAKYLAEAAAGHISGDVLIPLMVYRIPGFMELILPLSLFIGILMSYGRMYVNSEMIALFASGLERMRLVLYTLVPAGLVAAIVATFSLVVTPSGVEKSLMLLADPELSQGLNSVVSGKFQVKKNLGTTSYTEFVDQEGVMNGVYLIQSDQELDTSSIAITTAKTGQIRTDLVTGDSYIELENGRRYEGIPGQLDYQVMEFERFGELLPPSDQDIRKISVVDARRTSELFYSDKPKDFAALQWRISLPLMTLILSLIAFSMSETDPRRGRYLNMLPAFLVYVFYILLLSLARGRLEIGNQFIPGEMWAVHFLFLLISGMLFLGADHFLRIGKFFVKD